MKHQGGTMRLLTSVITEAGPDGILALPYLTPLL